MRGFNIAFVCLAVALISSCGATQQELQARADSNVLHYTIGKSYAEIAAKPAMDSAGLFLGTKAYGKEFSETRLPSGDRIYKHIVSREAFQSDFNAGGLIGGTKNRIDSGLFYFLVGPGGTIKDYGNGVVSGGVVKCTTYIGGIIKRCGNAQLAANDAAQMDAAVRTSSGQPISSWK